MTQANLLPPCPNCDAPAVLKVTRRGVRVACPNRFSTCLRRMSTGNVGTEKRAIKLWDKLIERKTDEQN